MILIITHKGDYTADFVIDRLNKLEIPYFRFNCEDCLSQNIQLSFDTDKQLLSLNGITQFHSVWYRRTKSPSIPMREKSEYLYLLNEVDTFMRNIFGMIKAKWISNPYAIEKAENKFLQLSLAAQLGLSIPKTLITTNVNELQLFLNANKKSIIKPVSRSRILDSGNEEKLIFTSIIPDNVKETIDEFEVTPAIFQEYIEKDYEIRVTVIGGEVFSAKVDSQSNRDSSVDWRKKPLTFEKYDLPEPIADKCRRMLEHLELAFGAFDFIKTQNNDYCFLELNPNGQWVWIEKDTGYRISDTIIKHLQ
jgi:glutathione synthase/RimK-type ligase-like ATP-grasp enzyme